MSFKAVKYYLIFSWPWFLLQI